MEARRTNKRHLPCQACRDAAAKAHDDYTRRRVLQGARPSYDENPRRRYRLVGGEVRVNPLGATRRLQALGVIGYGWIELHERTGLSANNLREIAAGLKPYIFRNTDAKITAIFDELSMHPPAPCRRVSIVKVRIAKHGWAPPLAWDEASIDDPDAWPRGMNFARTRAWVVRYGTKRAREEFDAEYGVRRK